MFAPRCVPPHATATSTLQGRRLASRPAHERGRLEADMRAKGEERQRDTREIVAASAVVAR